MGVDPPGRASLVFASEGAFPTMPDPTFLVRGPSELPSASSADGLVRAVRSGPSLKATHSNLVTVPICLGLRGFPGQAFQC